MDGIKHAIPSRRRQEWTDVLQTCRADIETISTTLRVRGQSGIFFPSHNVRNLSLQSRLESLATIGKRLA